MKRTIINIGVILLILAGCVGCKQADTRIYDLITVDVTADYPEKDMVLQDFMDVEYVALETSDEFITQGVVKAIGKNILLVTNWNGNGDILVFDRATGKGLRKINRFGQSGEEYSQVTFITLDENNNEIFIMDYPARKICVYDLYGNFHRSFPFADTSYYHFITNYDKDHLIGYKGYSPTIENEQSTHLLISKQDGSITREIQIPFKKIESPVVTKDGLVVTPSFCLIAPYNNEWVLTRTSSDTLYNYLPDGTIRPFIVRTPSIHSMDTEVFLFPTVLTDRYYFMHTMKKEVDFKTFKGFDGIDLVYDKQENAIFEYSMYNDDFSDKEQISLEQRPENPVNKEVITFETLNAPDLVEAYNKNQLKGKLKEIAANLDEESNPVIMLLKPKI